MLILFMGEVEDIKDMFIKTIELMKSQSEQQSMIIQKLIQDNQELKQEIKEVKNHLSSNQINSSNTKKDTLYSSLERKYKKKKKEIIMHKILESIKHGNQEIPEIKAVIVDELNYCSKASFYRYIEEMKRKEVITLNSQFVSVAQIIEK
jgi:23S rRNA G2069 N7-methylase RlmK/C1962 C5-methylase RlmI